MNKYYHIAELHVKNAIEELQVILPRDGEDISYYNSSWLESPIHQIVRAIVNMEKGKQYDKEVTSGTKK